MMAGHLIAQVIKNRHPQEETIRDYHQWMHHGFEHDIEKLKSLYKNAPESTRLDLRASSIKTDPLPEQPLTIYQHCSSISSDYFYRHPGSVPVE
jgi:hypothetical protein